jgi:hypothetical protein
MDNDNALSEQPASAPCDGTVDIERQAVLADLLDYTEILPSDIVRCFNLVEELDKKYDAQVAIVHELTTVYSKLPSIPPIDRPDPAVLRRNISLALEKALHYRRSAYEEVSRIDELSQRHAARITQVKNRLLAMPMPPSRDPTPPASPQLTRSKRVEAQRQPKLKVGLSEKKQKARKVLIAEDVDSALPQDGADDWESPRKRKVQPRSPESSLRTPKLKTPKQKPPKTPRSRPNMLGSNIKSAVAGISTSNALALLMPPPPGAQPGSKWRPWFKLTEWEMAKLRKSMKKNAIWSPSDAMVQRELEKDSRGVANYEKAKETARRAGQSVLDEEPANMSRAAYESTQPDEEEEEVPVELTVTSPDKEDANDGAEDELPDAPSPEPQGAKSDQKRPRTREQARELAAQEAQEALELKEVNDKIAEAALQMRDLFSRDRSALPTPLVISPASTQHPANEAPETTRQTRKRKRNSEREADLPAQLAFQLTSPKQRSKKKQKVAPNLSLVKTSPTGAFAPHGIVTTTTYIPLAPEGASSPAIKEQSASPGSPPDSPPFRRRPATPTATAAFSRPRRSSGAMRLSDPTSSPLRARAESDQEQPRGDASTRTRSSATTTTTVTTTTAKKAAAKAASAEPPPSRRELRDLRRASINADSPPSSMAPPSGFGAARATRSGRRPAPGLVTSEDNGKGKVSMGRRKTKPKKLAGRKGEERGAGDGDEEEIDPDEPTYCICGDVSWGTMVACDNQDVSDALSFDCGALTGGQCEKEWFHLECVGLPDIPPRRSKWYCPDCQVRLHVDEKGNGAVPSGRRK